MKSYLSLIPISAKVHRRQNKMTLLCIIFAVFLVTAVFSMAEMGIRMEQTRLLNKHGDLTFQEVMNSTTGQTLCITAVIFFVLILTAGVLMISSSINSNVTQRTKFFGMMRCIGMSKQQIIHFVKLEALNWCKTAIPIGILLGIIVTWGLCAILRFLVSEEFSDIPLFGISMVGIISGVIVGIVTVLIAAGAPAKRASKVSPVKAASGNSENAENMNHAVNINLFKIETALGIHHAVSAKKTLLLMTGSFALTIILFLSFSVLITFVGYIMPQSAAASDVTISDIDNSNGIDHAFLNIISKMDGVKRVFGRRGIFDIPAHLDSNAVEIDMVSYDDFDLDCLVKDDMLKKGSDISKVYGNSNYVLVYDVYKVVPEDVSCLSQDTSNREITLITSGDTFIRLTGAADYLLLLIQTTGDATDEDITAIRNILDQNCTLNDLRGQRTSGTYTAFIFCIYAFLSIITLVTVLNIVNSISMSVSSKIKTYGAMRAVGMDQRQISKMIAAEAFTYAVSGGIVGSTAGLIIYRLLYNVLIGSHFSYAIWSLPTIPLLIILLFVCMAAITAAYIPAKQIHSMAITAAINEL